jgi:hypothetical protein
MDPAAFFAAGDPWEHETSLRRVGNPYTHLFEKVRQILAHPCRRLLILRQARSETCRGERMAPDGMGAPLVGSFPGSMTIRRNRLPTRLAF